MSGLPHGMQIVGRPFEESTALRIGAAYGRRRDGLPGRPPLELPIAV